MEKARLALTKAVTIPRLELTAASLAELLKNGVDESPKFMYHTYSTTVLSYIANEHKRFYVFVANRIQLIS